MSEGRLSIRKNVVTSVFAFFINIILTFVGYRLVIIQGGTAALGLWSVMSSAIYLIRLGDVGVGSAVERQIATVDLNQTPSLARGYLDTALAINTVLFILLAAVGWAIFSNNIGLITNSDPNLEIQATQILPFMLSGFVVLNISNVISSGLRGLHLAWQAAYLSIAGSVVQLIAIITLVPTHGITGLAWGQLLQNVFIGCVAWWLFNRHIENQANIKTYLFPTAFSRVLFQKLFGFSIRAQSVNLINGLLEPASKFIVGHTAGMSILGLFEMAYKLVALPRNAVVSGVLGMTPAMTNLVRTDPPQARSLYRRSRYLVTVSSGLVLLLVVCGSPIVSYLAVGHMEMKLLGFTAILALGFWINAIGSTAYAIGFTTGQMGANFLSSVLSLLITITLGSLLQTYFPQMAGALGCAAALAIGGVTILRLNERIIHSS